jgi:predicted transcriptional regulator
MATTRTAPKRRAANRAKGSKKDQAIKMMKRARGASLTEMMKLTGWQKHTVRGFLSLLGSRDRLKIKSAIDAKGERRYRIAK